jgi:hypothetical protein
LRTLFNIELVAAVETGGVACHFTPAICLWGRYFAFF